MDVHVRAFVQAIIDLRQEHKDRLIQSALRITEVKMHEQGTEIVAN